jgi:hypothetical protein
VFTKRGWLVGGLLFAFPKTRIVATEGFDLQLAKGQRLAPPAFLSTTPGWKNPRHTNRFPTITFSTHYRNSENYADAHLKRQTMGREVVVAITKGKLDFGPWEQIFYGEFDGRRRKRALVKIIGD